MQIPLCNESDVSQTKIQTVTSQKAVLVIAHIKIIVTGNIMSKANEEGVPVVIAVAINGIWHIMILS